MTRKFTNLLMITGISSAILFSCNKMVDISDDQLISEDHVIAEQNSEEINSVSDMEDVTDNLNSLKTDDAANILSKDVKVEKDKSKNKSTIDFGDGFLAKNGKSFEGKIIKITNGKKYYESGYSVSITYENFSINKNKISGTKIIENIGLNALGQMSWTITVDHQITKANGKRVSYYATRTRTQIEGAATKELFIDDKFSITGNGKGMASNGMTFEMKITKPIILDMSCRQRTSGIIDYTRSGKDTRTKSLDYGEGTCDDLATLTINGQTKTISLK